MSVMVDFSMSPVGKGESMGDYVARCLEVVEKSGVDYELNAMGTILEGEWEECFNVIRDCYEALGKDCERVRATIKVDARNGASDRLEAKVRSVEKKVGHALST